MNEFQPLLDTLHKTISPLTPPVGVCLLDTVPEVKVRLANKKLTVCQQVAYARYYGWSSIIDASSSHCVLGAAAAGLVKAPERVLSGEVNCGVYQKDMDAAKAMQRDMPRLDQEKQAMGAFPLTRPVEGMSADVVVMYVNTAQAMRFVQAFLYHGGGEFVMKSSGDAGVCARGIAQCYMTGEPVVEIPCLGDRRFAMAQDNEMIVAFPSGMIEMVMDGLSATHKAGIRYPIPFQIPEGCDLPTSFTTMDDDLG